MSPSHCRASWVPPISDTRSNEYHGAFVLNMADQRHEYRVEPVFLSPTDVQTERERLNDTLNQLASKGWSLESTLRIDSSTFLFVFSRRVVS